MSRLLANLRTGTAGPCKSLAASMRGRLSRSKFQMNRSTSTSLPIWWASPCLNTLVIARQVQESLERSSQIIRVARGNRISKVATAKLPSLIHASPACSFSTKVRKTGTSFSPQCGCQIASRQTTRALVSSPSCRARKVFPLPAQPRMTIRAMIARYTWSFSPPRHWGRTFKPSFCSAAGSKGGGRAGGPASFRTWFRGAPCRVRRKDRGNSRGPIRCAGRARRRACR